MKLARLDFLLPDFVRRSWVSDAARDVWEPRFQRITNVWLAIEWLAILEGVRECAVTLVSPEEFVQKAGEWAVHGLNGLPIEIQGVSDASYASTSVKVEPGKPFVYRVVVGSPASVAAFKQAWDADDHAGIGRLLGYPTCCHQFFFDTWVDDGLVDTSWPMAVNSVTKSNSDTRLLEVGSLPEANILWRWMGLRAVPHLPCSFNCEATVALGKQFIEVGRKHGYEQEMDWLLEILSWPVSWSALHGVAEIKTPVMKVSTRTDATPWTYEVRRVGNQYPDLGARGLVFPYQMPSIPILTGSNGYQQGLVNPLTADESPMWLATDNGFTSVKAMNEAHAPIVELVTAVFPQQPARILDLGCGNGALLQAICKENSLIEPFGLDAIKNRVDHAKQLLPEFGSNFVVADMFAESGWLDNDHFGKLRADYFNLVLLMPGRLIEASPEQAETLKLNLKKFSQRILVYAYGDWLTQHDGLAGLCETAGLKLVDQFGGKVSPTVSLGVLNSTH